MCDHEKVFTFILNTTFDINTVQDKLIQWLKSISAKIETVSSNHISAIHVKLYPEYITRAPKEKHIVPLYWEKKIDFNYYREQNDTIIKICFYTNKENVNNDILLSRWWMLLIYNLKNFLGSNTDLPKYTNKEIKTMKNIVIQNSKIKIIWIIPYVLFGLLFLFISPIDVYAHFVMNLLGLLFILNSLVLFYTLYNTYKKIDKTLSNI